MTFSLPSPDYHYRYRRPEEWISGKIPAVTGKCQTLLPKARAASTRSQLSAHPRMLSRRSTSFRGLALLSAGDGQRTAQERMAALHGRLRPRCCMPSLVVHLSRRRSACDDIRVRERSECGVWRCHGVACVISADEETESPMYQYTLTRRTPDCARSPVLGPRGREGRRMGADG